MFIPRVCEAFEGKGAPSKGQYKGKAGKPEKGRLKAEALIREYLAKANRDGDSGQEVEDQGELDKDESEAELSTGSHQFIFIILILMEEGFYFFTETSLNYLVEMTLLVPLTVAS